MPIKTVNQPSIFVKEISSTFPELRIISDVLDEYSEEIREWLDEDFEWKNNGKGRRSIGSETYLRLAMLMFMRGYTYQELFIAIEDSISVGAFARMDPADTASKSSLHARISKISDATWMAISNLFAEKAIKEGLENPDKVRGDSSFIPVNVHFPTDWRLLDDVNKAILRLVTNFQRLSGEKYNLMPFSCKKSKNRLLKINQCRGEKRDQAFIDLIIGTYENSYIFLEEFRNRVLEFHAERGGENLHLPDAPNVTLFRLIKEVEHLIEWGQPILTQAYERFYENKKLKANEKILSLYEPHVDLLVKGNRDITIGHKFFLCQGESGMVLSAFSVWGNPSDSKVLELMLNDLVENIGKAPKQVSFDGGFASKDNVEMTKSLGVEDVCFSKKCRMKKDEMCSSNKVFNKLRNFRAGVESCFSYLKGKGGLSSVMWKGVEGFSAFVSGAVAIYNSLRYCSLKAK